jgi:hypothetical protein
MRWAEHVAHMAERSGAYRGLLGNLMERDHLEDVSADGMITVKWIFKK